MTHSLPDLNKTAVLPDNNLEQGFYNMLMQVPVAIVIFKSPAYIIEFANDIYLLITGKSRDELLNKPAFGAVIVAEEDKAAFLHILDDIRTTGRSFQVSEYPAVIERNGKKENTYLNIVYQPIKDSGGLVDKIMVMVTEVTEQVLARKSVEGNEDRLNNIVAQVNAGIAQTDIAGRFVAVNERYCAITGYTKEELLQKTMMEITHPDDLPNNLALFNKCIQEGENFFIEKRYVRKDGKEVWVNNSVALITSGSADQFITAVSIDITEQKEAEGKLRQSEILLQNITDAVISAGADYRITTWNKAAEQLYGWTEKEMVGRFMTDKIPTKFVDESQSNWQEIMSRNGFWKGEVIHTAKSGKNIHILASAAVIKNGEEEITGIVSINKDITERKQVEEEVKKIKTQLETTIENVPAAIYLFNHQGQILFANKMAIREMQEILNGGNLATDDLPALMQKGLEYVEYQNSEGQVLKQEEAPVAQAMMHKRPVEAELKQVHKKTNKRKWFLNKATPLLGAEGNVNFILVANTDITQQKEAQASLQLQSLVLEQMDEGVSISDESGIILLTNPAEDRMFGYEAGELAGKHVTVQNAYPPEENERIVSSVIAELKEKGFWSGEWYNRRKDGTAFYTHSYITTLVSEGRTYFVCVQRDITEEKKVAEALAYRKALLEAQNEAVPDAILIVDTKGKILSYNRHFAELWRIPKEIIDAKDDAAALQMAMTQVQDPQSFIDQVNYCYAHPDEAAYEEILFKDGRFIERYGNAVIGDDGTNYGYIWYFRDITERKQAEEALRASEDRYQNFIRQSTEGIWRFELDKPVSVHLPAEEQIDLFFEHGFLAECNDAMAQMYGYVNAQELTGVRLSRFFPRDKDTEAYFNYFMQSGYRVEAAESKEVDKNGATKYFMNNLLGIVEDGMLIRAWGTQRDITAQKEADQKIRESEERFRTLIESFPHLAWTATPEGKGSYFNKRWYEYTGITEEEAIAAFGANVVHPDDWPWVQEVWKQHLASGEPVEVEMRYRNKADGNYNWFLVRGTPVKDEQGKVMLWVGTCTNIQQLKDASARLEQQVQERTLQLNQINRELQRSNEDLQQFAHVASHDLKEPVRKVRTFINRLYHEFGSVLPEKAINYLSKINIASNRMYSMIDGVLLYSSLNAIDGRKEPVNLNGLIKSIETDLEVLIAQKEAAIIKYDLPVLTGSSVLLYQLFYNLVYNSLKFAKKDVAPVIQLRAEKADRDEIKKANLTGEYAYMKIILQDNGIGFSNEDAGKIFGTFTRLHSKDKYEGTGLGLALCKKIAERHGGAIRAQGEEGKGALFTVLLPSDNLL